MMTVSAPKAWFDENEEFFSSDPSSSLPPLNDNEMKSVRSLLAYASSENHIAEGVIRTMVSAHFNVVDITDLRSNDYDEVVAYLMGMTPASRPN